MTSVVHVGSRSHPPCSLDLRTTTCLNYFSGTNKEPPRQADVGFAFDVVPVAYDGSGCVRASYFAPKYPPSIPKKPLMSNGFLTWSGLECREIGDSDEGLADLLEQGKASFSGRRVSIHDHD